MAYFVQFFLNDNFYDEYSSLSKADYTVHYSEFIVLSKRRLIDFRFTY